MVAGYGGEGTAGAQSLLHVIGRYAVVLRIDAVAAVGVDKPVYGAGLYQSQPIEEGEGFGKLPLYLPLAVAVDVSPFPLDADCRQTMGKLHDIVELCRNNHISILIFKAVKIPFFE